jgi:hypothetical protein
MGMGCSGTAISTDKEAVNLVAMSKPNCVY